jgi:hypothetical protein
VPAGRQREEFAALLETVSRAVELEETHAYHIDYPGLDATRERCWDSGAGSSRRAASISPDDVFYLRRTSLRDAIADDWGAPCQSSSPRAAQNASDAAKHLPARRSSASA